ncbi:hypothetical protein ATANTOWER_003922 [Ataeniobius toweri]|uniref:Uncharacterized protein n=1 Tax=Ataeniobius toweri TaxID=208326 RepID=A0ABU7AY40_9TELE|nr:hypothetical protein [Ataeniobius toweri]
MCIYGHMSINGCIKLRVIVGQLWHSWRTSPMEEVGGSVFFTYRTDLLAHDDVLLISRFRLPSAIILELCMELASVLQKETRRNCALRVPVPSSHYAVALRPKLYRGS